MADSVPTDPPPAYTAPSVPIPRPGPPQRPPLNLPALNLLRSRRVILASASPRRRALLAQIGLTNIEIIPSNFPETLDKSKYTPFEYVSETAHGKCQDVYIRELDNKEKGEPGVVIAADTVIVDKDGRVLEKPRSREDHLAMLRALRDCGGHQVLTAIVAMAPREDCLHPGYTVASHVEETIVKFDQMVTDDLIESYVNTREGIDKAGGYAIQGLGSILIERIEGSYDNVVGLPLRSTLKIIEKVMNGGNEDEMGESDED